MPADLAAASDPLVAGVVEAPNAADPDAVYLGMGVTSRHELSSGLLPLDALGMLVLADRERARRGAAQVIHVVADAHALVNAFAVPADVDRVAGALHGRLLNAIEALGLPSYRVLRASEIKDELHRELHAQASEGCADPYAARQAADVEWARQRFGATVKIGWMMGSSVGEPSGFDERYFDRVYREVFDAKVTAVYGYPGRRLDAERPRTSPYTVAVGEGRLTLDSTPADVAAACASRSMRRHLRPLCAELQRVLDLEPSGDLAESLTAVLRRLNPSFDHPTKESHRVV